MERFTRRQIATVNEAAAVAEELVSNAYKMSTSQWLGRRYDIRTISGLDPEEVIEGPFAQIIRFEGRRHASPLGSSSYDFYKICLQDHRILAVLADSPGLDLFPFILYIITHELIHIVRFSTFRQNFVASAEETLAEEARVHARTREILQVSPVAGLENVLAFFARWQVPVDGILES